MQPKALLVGNSDGIGLAATKRLLAEGWEVFGVSKSELTITNVAYRHLITDVRDRSYPEMIKELTSDNSFDLCVYFAGIGEPLDPLDMIKEPEIFDVNLTGMVKTAAGIIPDMVRKRGHFIGLSSVADELLSAQAPSYHASKAGFSNYLGGLALSLKSSGVYVTNVRFGFVDTKMAKGDVKPFMMSVEKAVDHLVHCIRKKPVSYTAPKIIIPLIKSRKLMMKLGSA